MAKPKLIYWDSCIFIDAIQGNPEWNDVLSHIISAAEAGEVMIVTSALTLAEVIRDNKTDAVAGDPEQETNIVELFDNTYVSVRTVDKQIGTLARQIARDYRLKPPDAVHVATALSTKVAELHTRDGENGKTGGMLSRDGRISLPGGLPLKIILPTWTRQMTLPVPPDLDCEDTVPS